MKKVDGVGQEYLVQTRNFMMNRRTFLGSAAGALTARSLSSSAAPSGDKLKIGLDHFAVRGTGWKAPQLIEYAASLKLDVLFLSELGPFESYEDEYLKKLKAQADAAGKHLAAGRGLDDRFMDGWQ